MPTKEARKGDAQERAGPTVLTKATTKMAAREQASEQSRCRNHKKARDASDDGTDRRVYFLQLAACCPMAFLGGGV